MTLLAQDERVACRGHGRLERQRAPGTWLHMGSWAHVKTREQGCAPCREGKRKSGESVEEKATGGIGGKKGRRERGMAQCTRE